MRGKVNALPFRAYGMRITPAYAGKRDNGTTRKNSQRDHPRVCGEKQRMPAKKDKRMGSPPRMRGKGDQTTICLNDEGITPAYAGKSGHDHHQRPCGQDHPRVCGEKLKSRKFLVLILGSPPRMRGKVKEGKENIDRTRITPAYAGKRMAVRSAPVPLPDHPRVCGEKYQRGGMKAAQKGSPPRMRGKVGSMSMAVRTARITPAYAGKRTSH